jgi:transcriptional regulator with XRE-family HTH domain
MWMSKKAAAFLEKAQENENYWVIKAKMDFSSELATRAAEQKLNGKSLAEKLGTSAAYISKMFRGDANLTIESMVKLARATNSHLEIKIVNQQAALAAKPIATTMTDKVVRMPNAFSGKLAANYIPSNTGDFVGVLPNDPSCDLAKVAA